jgi:hypothetical protein
MEGPIMDPLFDDSIDSPRYPLSYMLRDALILLTPSILMFLGALFLG